MIRVYRSTISADTFLEAGSGPFTLVTAAWEFEDVDALILGFGNLRMNAASALTFQVLAAVFVNGIEQVSGKVDAGKFGGGILGFRSAFTCHAVVRLRRGDVISLRVEPFVGPVNTGPHSGALVVLT